MTSDTCQDISRGGQAAARRKCMVPENSVWAVTKTGPKPGLIWDHNEEHVPLSGFFWIPSVGATWQQQQRRRLLLTRIISSWRATSRCVFASPGSCQRQPGVEKIPLDASSSQGCGPVLIRTASSQDLMDAAAIKEHPPPHLAWVLSKSKHRRIQLTDKIYNLKMKVRVD